MPQTETDRTGGVALGMLSSRLSGRAGLLMVIERHETQQAWQAHQPQFQPFVGAQAPSHIPFQGPVDNPGPQMPQPAQRERWDFNAELMDGFRNAYNER